MSYVTINKLSKRFGDVTVFEDIEFTIEQGELHSQHNNYDEDVTWIYFGIATD